MTNYYSDQMERSKMHGWHLYVISMQHFCKIGTASQVSSRLSSLQCGNPFPLTVSAVWHFKCRNEARAVERAAHAADDFRRLPKSEWGECIPATAISLVQSLIDARDSEAARLEAVEAA